MREVKYRFWDKTSGAWLKEDAVTVDGNGKVFLFGEYHQQNENIIPLQYTGLKDKNGEEIYEGDVIELVNEDKETILVVCEYGIARRYVMSGGIGVEVDIPSFYFKLANGKRSFPIVRNYAGKHDLQIFEVIGNIYKK